MNFTEYLTRKRAEYGERFDPSELDPRFAPYLGTQTRIKVETCGTVKTGTVGVTTGWRPVFLLMHNRRCVGSSWTLTSSSRLLAIKPEGERHYTPTERVA
jgi:hypothetical protein